MTNSTICPKCQSPLPADAPGGVCPQCVLGMAAESSPATQAPSHAGPPISVEELSARLPHLEVLELIGQGGMGAVYKAKQASLDRVVAIKVLPPEFAKDPTFAERFAREVRTLGQLNHANIVAVYDSGEIDGLHYFIMEYVDGLNLRQLMQAGELAADEALAIVPQICEALQYAHDAGVVHRDIKPENIMIDSRGQVKVADFGLAKLVQHSPGDVSLTMSQQVMGTWRYMAPEQIEKPDSVDHRTDIYALGVVLYELLTGNLPIGRFELPSEKKAVAVGLDRVVLKALEHEMDKRYQKVSSVKTDLEVASREAPPQRRQADPPHPADRERETVSTEEVEAAQTSLAIPAWGLIVVGAINCILPILGAIFSCVALYIIAEGPSGAPTAMLGVMEIIIIVFMLVVWGPVGALCIIGGRRMLSMNGRGWAIVGCIAAMLPLGPAFLIGLPFGIWGLVLLLSPDVNKCFDRKKRRPRPEPGPTLPPTKEPLRDHGMEPSHRASSNGASATLVGCGAVLLVALALPIILVVASLFMARSVSTTTIANPGVVVDSVNTQGQRLNVAYTLFYSQQFEEGAIPNHVAAEILNQRLNSRLQLARIEVNGQSVTIGVYNDLNNLDAVKARLATQGHIEFAPLAHAERNKEIVELTKTRQTGDTIMIDRRIVARWVEFAGDYESVASRADWVVDETGPTPKVLVLQNIPALKNDQIIQCSVEGDDKQPQLEITFRDGDILSDMTSEVETDEQPLFIGFMIDGKLQMAPQVRSQISDKIALTGDFDKETLQVWADVIRSGALPAPLKLIYEQRMYTGPTGPMIEKEAAPAPVETRDESHAEAPLGETEH